MTKELEIYNAAVSELTAAVNALDQAHAMLKDLKLDTYISTKTWGRHVNLLDAVAIADKLLFDLQHATCLDCGAPLADNPACLADCCPSLEKEQN